MVFLEGTSLVQHVLHAEGFGVAFGERVILAELSFDVPATGITVLMGPSGTGKSTLVRALAGLSQANARYREWGQVSLMGRPLEAGHRPALVVQNPRALSARVGDFLADRCRQAAGGASSSSALREQTEALLTTYGCEDLLPRLSEQTIRLPAGLQRCVAILGELAQQPALLMVDEPMATLSDADSQRVADLLRRVAERVPVLMITHHQRQARELGAWVRLIAGGRVQAAQPAAEFFTAPANDVAAQFVRTGSCCVASPDASADVLSDGVEPPPPLPPEALVTPVVAPAPQPPLPTGLDEELAAELAVAQDDGLLRQPQEADPTAQPEYRGPRGFRWILPGRLGTAPLPGAVLSIDLDLVALKTVGVTMLITLTRGDLPQAKLAEHGLRNLHLPIYDREAPSTNQLRMLAIRMTRLLEQGEVLCVHCRAGLGRTGTVVAGWLMHQGMTADAALQRLREIDKEYVQSANQEAFLHELEASFAR